MSNRANRRPIPTLKTGIRLENIYYEKSQNEDRVRFYYERNLEKESILIANQYFVIEDILLSSLDFVFPIYENRNISSAKFATIIRESSNSYEILARKVHGQMFQSQNLNILDYLYLEKYLQLSKMEVDSTILTNFYDNGGKIEPFKEIKNWNGVDPIETINTPAWWNAYNSIKHDTNGMVKNATFENAILSLSAIFLMITRIYGHGLITNFLNKPIYQKGRKHEKISVRASKIFKGEELFTSQKATKPH